MRPETEASQLLRASLTGAILTPAELKDAAAHLATLERVYLDTKASRDEDDHAKLVKLISLDGSPLKTQLTIGGAAIRNVMRATLDIIAGRYSVAHLHVVGYDEAKFGGWQGPQPPTIERDLELTSFVFRGVRG